MPMIKRKRQNLYMAYRKKSKYVPPKVISARYKNRRTGGFLGIEKKFEDKAITSTALVATVAGAEHNPTGDCLNSVAQGDGESQRDGRKYKMHSIHIKGFLQQPGTSTKGGTANCRVAVVIDTQANGAAMNAEDCFKETGAGSQSVQAFRNLQFSGRFVVLYDKTFTLNRLSSLGNGTANDSSEVIQNFNINVNIPEKHSVVVTDGTTANVTAITNNAIHFLAWVNDVTDAPNVRYESRLRFTG